MNIEFSGGFIFKVALYAIIGVIILIQAIRLFNKNQKNQKTEDSLEKYPFFIYYLDEIKISPVDTGILDKETRNNIMHSNIYMKLEHKNLVFEKEMTISIDPNILDGILYNKKLTKVYELPDKLILDLRILGIDNRSWITLSFDGEHQIS